MELNLENLQRLKDWLDDGAPNFVFSMDYDFVPIAEMSEHWPFRDQMNEKGIGTCGTVCCIAGQAAFMSGFDPRDKSWTELATAAGNFLGLEISEYGLGHPLFDSMQCPEDCTPAQAAVAVQRVMQGRHPWH